MGKKLGFLKVGATTGQPMQVGGQTLTPEAQVVTVNTRFGGFVWNRPTAVLVDRDGATERVPIVDVTRYALMALWGVSAGVLALAWMNGRRLIQMEE